MNTPPKIRRYTDWRPGPGGPGGLEGTFVGSLANPEYATRFAVILSQFEHLESFMPRVLAHLLGMGDPAPAGYVYRALRNPNIRSEVMRWLLEKAPHNKNLGDDFDRILAEYEAVRAGRNGYAHGLWYTHEDTGTVFLARRDEHGFGLFEAAVEPIKSLDELIQRIGKLLMFAIDVLIKAQPSRKPLASSPRRSAKPKASKAARRRKKQE